MQNGGCYLKDYSVISVRYFIEVHALQQQLTTCIPAADALEAQMLEQQSCHGSVTIVIGMMALHVTFVCTVCRN